MKRILIIDDEPDIVKVLKLRLEKAGFGVSTASDGEEGLLKTRRDLPDLIILDVMMPKIDGYSLILGLKSDKLMNRIPVIVLTAREKLKELFEVEGVSGYFTKPFDAAEIISKIKDILGIHTKEKNVKKNSNGG